MNDVDGEWMFSRRQLQAVQEMHRKLGDWRKEKERVENEWWNEEIIKKIKKEIEAYRGGMLKKQL